MESRKFGVYRKSAFTLVELLVVIGIIALLISILLPSLNKAKRQAVQIQCAANLHNIGLSLFSYAVNNRNQLPQFLANNVSPTPGGDWMWDVEVGLCLALVQYGATRNTLYCPRNSDEMNVDGLWDFSVTPPTPPTGPPPAQTGFAVLGYFFLITRPDTGYPNSDAIPYGGFNTNFKWNYQSNLTPHNTSYPKTVVLNSMPRPNVASTTELAIDATVSTTQFKTTASFGGIKGGYPQPHQTAHWYGGLPVGGNILFLDGHGEWRPFASMVARSVPNGANAPFFWW